MTPIYIRFFVSIVFLLCSHSNSFSGTSILSPQQFSENFISHIKLRNPTLKFEITNPLEVRIKAPDGSAGTNNLSNAYSEYLRTPQMLDAIFERHATLLTQVADIKDSKALGLDTTLIMPIIKSSEFVAASKRQLEELQIRTGEKPKNILVSQPLTQGLYVYYVFDLPDSVRFLTESDINRLNLKEDQLLNIAINNLGRTIGSKINMEQRGSLYLLRAGGYYESSLILLKSIWTKENFRVKGDLTALVLARDTVLVTGTEEKDALQAAAKIVEMADKLPYPISKTKYVRRNDTWAPL